MIAIDVPKGTYVVAVSGGVDSMVLLDLLTKLPDRELIVAHVNHGIRDDAAQDAELVSEAAMSHNLVYESIYLQLGPDASEAEARAERYQFLRETQRNFNADAILTAHHLDDVYETALINMLRGTGWRGLSSLRSSAELIRPLLGFRKAELEMYARQQNLAWREDSTNSDQAYLRNYVRHSIIPRASSAQLEKLHQYIVRQNNLTTVIDAEAMTWLAKHTLLHSPVITLPRYEFCMMPTNVAHELLQTVLRQKTGKSLPRPLVDTALLFIKVAKAHKTLPLGRDWQLRALSRSVIVEQRPTVVS